MPKKSKQVSDLEAQLAAALNTINAMSQQQASLSQQLGAVQRVPLGMSGQLVVGVRNVSNYTVGFIDRTSGTPIEYALTPEVPGNPDPKTRAVVSYAYWQKLRTSSQVAKGLIVRDDSVLGSADNRAPADRPEDMPAEAALNLVINPRDWILSKPEPELRAAIKAMTSEPSLRRLLYAVDQEVVAIGEERYKGDKDRAAKSISDLPALFRLVEELASNRLDELNPVSAARADEIGESVRNRVR
jgi:hypothetical protein